MLNFSFPSVGTSKGRGLNSSLSDDEKSKLFTQYEGNVHPRFAIMENRIATFATAFNFN